MTSTIEDQRPSGEVERTVIARQRAAVRTREIAELLLRRPDLAGVHAPADVALDAVTWSA